jgi:hypothetical protein
MEAMSDTSLFVYINDIILTASNKELLRRTTTTLQQQFISRAAVDDLFLH